MKYTIINALILSMVLLDVMPEPARKSGSRCTRNDDDIYVLPAPAPADTAPADTAPASTDALRSSANPR